MGVLHDSGMFWGFFGYHLLIRAKAADVALIDRMVTTLREQIDAIDALLDERINVLLFRAMATDHAELLAVLRRAQDRGVHLISLDGLPGGGLDICSVTADNFGGQAALADYLFRQMKRKGKVAYIQGDMRTDAGVLRDRGLRRALLEHPKIELVFAESLDWSSPVSNFHQGADLAGRILLLHPDVNAILCATDEGALGVTTVVEQTGLRGKVLVGGFDGMPEAITALDSCALEATARQPLDTMAELAFELAMNLCAGEVKTVVHYVQDVEVVTRANLGMEALRALRVFPEVTADLNQRTTEQKDNAVFLEALFDVMPTLVLVKDARDLRYIRANKARDDCLNVPRGSQVGKFTEDFDPPDLVARYNAEERAILESGETLDIPDEEFEQPGSGTRHMRTRKIPIFDATGKPEYLMVISEDITHQRQTQKALMEHAVELERTRQELKASAEKLAQAEKMASLGALVAGVSHELNTPIGNALLAVTTFADHTRRITDKVQSGMTRSALEAYFADAAKGAEILVRNLSRSAELIQSFKQIAADQSSSQARTFNLATVVDEIVLAAFHAQKKNAVVIECDIPVDLILTSFPGPLEQVLMSLVNNAIIHGFEGREAGRIAISARLAQPGWVEIAVSDDGVGIPPDRIKRVFDPFFSTKFGKGRSGLGLSIANNIVTRLLGGQIDVKSQPGAGARFAVLIPLQAPDHHE